METSKRKEAYVQVRVWQEDKELLDNLASECDLTLPKVIHRIIEERPKLGKRNMAFLNAEAKRTGKTVWQVLDRIVFEYEAKQVFKQQDQPVVPATVQDSADAEAVMWHEHLARQWNEADR